MKSITELEALAAQRGYELQAFVANESYPVFVCRYRGDTDIDTLQTAVAMSLRNYADRYFCIQITPCEMPAKIESDPGEYYRKKDKEALALSAMLAAARKREAPASEIQRLERALERARYVGD